MKAKRQKAMIALLGALGFTVIGGDVAYPQQLELAQIDVKEFDQEQFIREATRINEANRLFQQVVQLYQEGKYAEAIPLAEQALTLYKEAVGEDHLAVAQTLNNLAVLYENQGRYSEVEPLYQQALAIQKRALGDDHPNVASSLNNLAGLYYRQGRYSEAEPLFKQALAMHKRLFPDDHPNVATSLNNLALLYESQGRYSEAEPLYQQALAMRQRLFPDDHPVLLPVSIIWQRCTVVRADTVRRYLCCNKPWRCINASSPMTIPVLL
ncbi:tetratricopeptide repeat protein [Dactylococcopsis salina]|uniref:Tetratricopeptide repeat protein n=1 Tax=Dactylococcopsis salina (strain PCC 8305) TaxID=13035 RepID=K9YPR7_DACS8|nr:tetratricopeptide repeat-containing protein [Dactylococcopsis salina]AFZ48869.1 tetratricopeptide repeat protein [Dactylococcopsis salina PCC 8305]